MTYCGLPAAFLSKLSLARVTTVRASRRMNKTGVLKWLYQSCSSDSFQSSNG